MLPHGGAGPDGDRERSVDDGRINDALELAPEVERTGWQQLRHEHDGEVLGWVDPEDRRRRAAPHEFACRPDDAGAGGIHCDGYGEPEPHPVELEFAVATGQRERYHIAA